LANFPTIATRLRGLLGSAFSTLRLALPKDAGDLYGSGLSAFRDVTSNDEILLETVLLRTRHRLVATFPRFLIFCSSSGHISLRFLFLSLSCFWYSSKSHVLARSLSQMDVTLRDGQ